MTITEHDIADYLLRQGYDENWHTFALATEAYEWLTVDDPTQDQLDEAIANAVDVALDLQER